MKRPLVAIAALLSLCCAVNAQTPPNSGSAMVPNTPPTQSTDFTDVIVGNWYLPGGIAGNISGTAPGIGSIRLVPGYITKTFTLGALGVRISTLSAGGNVQAAIYANNPATGRPTGNALATTASMSTAATGSVNASVNVQLTPGLYWFATCMDNATSALAAVTNTSGIGMSYFIGSATQANALSAGTLTGVSVSGTFGTWPSMTSQTFNEGAGSAAFGIVQFQVLSIP